MLGHLRQGTGTGVRAQHVLDQLGPVEGGGGGEGGPRAAAGCPPPPQETHLPIEAVSADAEAGVAAPGAVGIPSKDAVRARLVAAAVSQGQLGHLETGPGEEQLLRGQGERER